MKSQLSETDASLLSWLHSLPLDTFACPFEEKALKINMDRFIKPSLEATWADLILTNPMKPHKVFPFNALPQGRPRNTELMSRSLAPQYDGLSFGLNRSLIFNGAITNKEVAKNVLADVTHSIAHVSLAGDLKNDKIQMSVLNDIKEEETVVASPVSPPPLIKAPGSPKISARSSMNSAKASTSPNSIVKPKSTEPLLDNVTNMYDSTLFRVCCVFLEILTVF